MSKKHTPVTETRRRNPQRDAATPADELREVLETTPEAHASRLLELESQLDPTGQSDMTEVVEEIVKVSGALALASEQNAAASENAALSSAQEVSAKAASEVDREMSDDVEPTDDISAHVRRLGFRSMLFEHEIMLGQKLYIDANEWREYKALAKPFGIELAFKPTPDPKTTLCEVVATANGAGIDGWVGQHSYHPRNLILIITRFPKSVPGISEDGFRAMLERRAFSIEGLARGFSTTDTGPGKATVTPNTSFIRMTISEVYGRPVGRSIETWGQRIGVLGINDNSTLDFMLIETDPTFTQVVDAWNCAGMYPAHCSSADGTRTIRRVEAVPAGVVKMDWAGTVAHLTHVEAAKALLDKLNADTANPYEPDPVEKLDAL